MFISHKTLSMGAGISMLASLLGAAPLVLADEVQCRGAIGAVTLDNIFVPDGATCVLTGTRAKGNIVVRTAASLRATRVSVNGNIQAEGTNSVAVNAEIK